MHFPGLLETDPCNPLGRKQKQKNKKGGGMGVGGGQQFSFLSVSALQLHFGFHCLGHGLVGGKLAAFPPPGVVALGLSLMFLWQAVFDWVGLLKARLKFPPLF